LLDIRISLENLPKPVFHHHRNTHIRAVLFEERQCRRSEHTVPERPQPDDQHAAAMRHSLQVQDEMLQATLDLGGTVSAEHGVGVVRKAWLPRQRGEGAVAAMRAIKAALDPLGILNPGRVI